MQRFGRTSLGTLSVTVVTIVAVVLTSVPLPSARAAVPTGFTDQLVTFVPRPTAIAFTPDGRGVITTQTGTVRILTTDGTLLSTPALSLGARVCTNNERGLLGVAVDPSFATNRFIYLYWTFSKFGVCPTTAGPTSPVNRLARYVLRADNTIAPASETLLLDNIPSPTGWHNAGDLEFGKDGFLYVTIGEGGQGANARNMALLSGKVLRITRAGGIPAGNPFTGTGSDPCGLDGRNADGRICREIYASGLRNPFRMAHNPNAPGVEVFVNDVGANHYEEVNRLAPGADYGWNLREGPCVFGQPTNCGPPPSGLTNPIYSYPHDDSMCNAITGGAFVPNGVWSSTYWNDYLYADYTCGTIFRLEPNGAGGFTRSSLVTGLGRASAVHLQFGPFQGTQALYYTVFGTQGQVRRLSFTSGNVEPTARLTAAPTSGPAPLAVTLDGSGSFDPEGSGLTYLWDFGDGATATTTSPVRTHTYPAGSFTASLRVRDTLGLVSSPATAFISAGNSPPTATIDRPREGIVWRVGGTVRLLGSATDAEDGALPASALTWTVLLHHDDHVHPLLLQTGNDLTFTFPAPEDIPAAATSYVEVILEATDSGGLTSVVARDVLPRTVSVTLQTDPAGRRVRMHGEGPFIGPTTVTGWAGWRVRLNALTPQDGWRWVRWSDGGAAIHAINLPNRTVIYTATYTR